jgi:2-dehydropantoate 2-reductase
MCNNARVAIYGAGAMGTVLGAFLTAGGLQNVQLITRNQAHVAGLNKGARIVCAADNDERIIQVQACTPNEMSGKYDVVFLMTKQRDNQKILQFLLPFLHENSVVCTTQNGLPEQVVASVVGANRTFFGVASFGANMLQAGEVALTSKREAMHLDIAPVQQDNQEKTQRLLDILSYAGKALGNNNFATYTKNALGARWSKLAINSAFSGLSVVTGLTFGEIAKRRCTKKIALGILRETFEVANASGVTLEKMQGHDLQKLLGGTGFFKTRLALALLPVAMKKHKKLTSGMLKDVLAGKKCEIDYICGAVVAAGKRVGVETPLCEKVVEIVHGIENGLYEIAIENIDFFKGI